MSPDDKAREAIRLTLEWDERRGYLMPYAVRDKLRLAYESAKQKGEAEGWRNGRPPNDATVLVVCAATPKNNTFSGRRDVMPIYVGPDGKFDPNPENEFWKVTHWRPLPEPPTLPLPGPWAQATLVCRPV